MRTCSEPLYIQIVGGIVIGLTALVILYGIFALCYYAGYGYSASKRHKKEIRNDL